MWIQNVLEIPSCVYLRSKWAKSSLLLCARKLSVVSSLVACSAELKGYEKLKDFEMWVSFGHTESPVTMERRDSKCLFSCISVGFHTWERQHNDSILKLPPHPPSATALSASRTSTTCGYTQFVGDGTKRGIPPQSYATKLFSMRVLRHDRCDVLIKKKFNDVGENSLKGNRNRMGLNDTGKNV